MVNDGYSCLMMKYCGWLGNPASPKAWLKAKQNNGMFTTFQLVQDFATIHGNYVFLNRSK